MRFLVSFLFILIITLPASAAVDAPSKILSDPKLEAQAQAMFENIKCPVCEGQALSSSNADLAIDMRQLIRKKLNEGENQEEIYDFLKQRYGDEIDLRATLSLTTALLYLLPFAVFLIGIGIFSGIFMHRTIAKKKDPEAKKK